MRWRERRLAATAWRRGLSKGFSRGVLAKPGGDTKYSGLAGPSAADFHASLTSPESSRGHWRMRQDPNSDAVSRFVSHSLFPESAAFDATVPAA